MSSVIRSIPGAEIELNSESLLSHGLQFTTASVSEASVLSRLPQKGSEELSEVFAGSEEQWRLPGPSKIFDSPTKIFIYKHIPLLISLVIYETQMQTSLPSEYLLLLFHPSTRDLQTLNHSLLIL